MSSTFPLQFLTLYANLIDAHMQLVATCVRIQTASVSSEIIGNPIEKLVWCVCMRACMDVCVCLCVHLYLCLHVSVQASEHWSLCCSFKCVWTSSMDYPTAMLTCIHPYLMPTHTPSPTLSSILCQNHITENVCVIPYISFTCFTLRLQQSCVLMTHVISSIALSRKPLVR